MTKQNALNLRITIYWWNHGQKKKDFTGTYKEWFKNNKISIRDGQLLTIKGSYGSIHEFKLKLTKDYVYAFNLVIKLCLTYMGDQAMLIDGFNREYKINWR